MYLYVKINVGKIMRKLSTKVRRVLVLTAMFVVMASIPVMAAIDHPNRYMDTELTVYRANGEKRCVAKTIANTNEFIYSHLHLIITYNDSSEWDTYRDAIGKGCGAERTTSYEMDIDCFDTEHWVSNSNGDACNTHYMSSN